MSASPEATSSKMEALGAHDLMTPPSEADVKALLAEWTPATLVEHLITSMAGPRQQRIARRHAVHQLMNLLPHLPEREQAMALRRLRRFLVASQHNLHVCTAQLHLVDILLRWLQPPAPAPSTIVCNELLELVGRLGGYRVTMHELRTLFDMLRSSIDAIRDPAAPPAPSAAHGGGFELAQQQQQQTTCHATPEQLLQLLITWCQPAVDAASVEAGPEAPRVCFDLDGSGAGLELPHWLPSDLVSKGAFSVGFWVRLESGGTDGGLLFSMVDRHAECGLELTLQARPLARLGSSVIPLDWQISLLLQVCVPYLLLTSLRRTPPP